MKDDYSRRKSFSDKKIIELRENIETHLGVIDFPATLITVGSFARREACESSDIDYFIMYENKEDTEKASRLLQELQGIILNYIPKLPSPQGAFNCVELKQNMLDNIGGNGDENNKVTRRILTLLEGTYLYNNMAYTQIKKSLIQRYLQDIEGKQIARFLLNDFVRYYRTVCVDFEFKTKEGNKPWGIRNIKLGFSRKLLYFSGVITVAETSGLEKKEMADKLYQLLELPVCERLKEVFGDEACKPALKIYNEFLHKISIPEIRTELEHIIDREGRKHSNAYLTLKVKGNEFTEELDKLLKGKFNEQHNIHKALIY